MSDNDQDRFLAAIAKLIELTQLKQLKWVADQSSEPDVLGDPRVRNSYVADYEGRKLRICERKYTTPSLRRQPNGQTKYVDVWRPVLELSEPNGDSWWSFPRMEPVADLLRAVQYQISGIDDFVNSLLNKPA